MIFGAGRMSLSHTNEPSGARRYSSCALSNLTLDDSAEGACFSRFDKALFLERVRGHSLHHTSRMCRPPAHREDLDRLPASGLAAGGPLRWPGSPERAPSALRGRFGGLLLEGGGHRSGAASQVVCRVDAQSTGRAGQSCWSPGRPTRSGPWRGATRLAPRSGDVPTLVVPATGVLWDGRDRGGPRPPQGSPGASVARAWRWGRAGRRSPPSWAGRQHVRPVRAGRSS